jgi:hypothetical protein
MAIVELQPSIYCNDMDVARLVGTSQLASYGHTNGTRVRTRVRTYHLYTVRTMVPSAPTMVPGTMVPWYHGTLPLVAIVVEIRAADIAVELEP